MSIGFREEGAPPPDRYVSTVAIAAAIIAAVRVAKFTDEDLTTRKVATIVTQSVLLARTILDEALKRV